MTSPNTLMSATNAVQPPRRTLVRDMLNVVGETHTESNSRRAAEQRFAFEKTDSHNYWTEADFPDLHQKLGIRSVRGGQGESQGNPAADLMEFRAAHSAAMLIVRFEELAGEALRVAATTPSESATRAVLAFIDVNFRSFIQFRDRLNRSWRTTGSPEVNAAVSAVYEKVESVGKTYLAAFRDAPLDQRLKATKVLAGNCDALRGLVPPLAKAAVGEYPPADSNAAALAREMRTERSKYMGLAAVFMKQERGVWKIGNLHVADLTDGTVKVDVSQFNLVSKEDFNQEFEAWRRQQST